MPTPKQLDHLFALAILGIPTVLIILGMFASCPVGGRNSRDRKLEEQQCVKMCGKKTYGKMYII